MLPLIFGMLSSLEPTSSVLSLDTSASMYEKLALTRQERLSMPVTSRSMPRLRTSPAATENPAFVGSPVSTFFLRMS